MILSMPIFFSNKGKIVYNANRVIIRQNNNSMLHIQCKNGFRFEVFKQSFKLFHNETFIIENQPCSQLSLLISHACFIPSFDNFSALAIYIEEFPLIQGSLDRCLLLLKILGIKPYSSNHKPISFFYCTPLFPFFKHINKVYCNISCGNSKINLIFFRDNIYFVGVKQPLVAISPFLMQFKDDISLNYLEDYYGNPCYLYSGGGVCLLAYKDIESNMIKIIKQSQTDYSEHSHSLIVYSDLYKIFLLYQLNTNPILKERFIADLHNKGIILEKNNTITEELLILNNIIEH